MIVQYSDTCQNGHGKRPMGPSRKCVCKLEGEVGSRSSVTLLLQERYFHCYEGDAKGGLKNGCVCKRIFWTAPMY